MDRAGIAALISSYFLQYPAQELLIAKSVLSTLQKMFFYFDALETRMNLTSSFCSSASAASGELIALLN